MKKNLTILILPFLFLIGCESNPSIPEKNTSTSLIKNNKNKQVVAKKTRDELVNYEQKEKGLYKITTDDIYLMSNYSKLVSYKVIKSTKSGTSDLYLPYYQPLQMTRHGKISMLTSWNIKVEENKSGNFNIEGINSKGEKLKQECSTLAQCFTLI